MKKSELYATGIVIIGQVLTATIGFLILMAVFEFPDILRAKKGLVLDISHWGLGPLRGFLL